MPASVGLEAPENNQEPKLNTEQGFIEMQGDSGRMNTTPQADNTNRNLVDPEVRLSN